MSQKLKNHSTAKRSALMWLIFLSPLVSLATYMVASHNGLDDIAAAKLAVAVMAAWWLVSYIFIRVTRWRRSGPSSLPPQ